MKIDDENAKLLVEKVLGAMDVLCVSASIVRENCDEKSFSDYQLNVATLVAEIEDVLLKLTRVMARALNASGLKTERDWTLRRGLWPLMPMASSFKHLT